MMLPWMSETLSSLPAIINMPMFTNEWADCCMMTCLTLARVYIKELELGAHMERKRRKGVYPLWETLRSCGNSNDSRSDVRKAKFALLEETAKFAAECNVRPCDVRLQNYAAYTDIYKKLKSNIIFYDEEHAKNRVYSYPQEQDISLPTIHIFVYPHPVQPGDSDVALEGAPTVYHCGLIKCIKRFFGPSQAISCDYCSMRLTNRMYSYHKCG